MHEDLLAQAEQLALIDSQKPKQVNLRRAVSATYYAAFHLLVEESCRIMIGAQRAQQPYRFALGRAFSHTTMKLACKSFSGGTLKDAVVKGLPRNSSGNYSIPREIQDTAKVFVALQEKRHLADYDRSECFKRSDVLTVIDETKTQLTEFLSLSISDDKRFFLACLWAWKELTNR